MAGNESPRGGDDRYGEQPAGGVAGTALVTGDTFVAKALNYAALDGQAMFEGDISLGPLDEIEARNEAVRAALDPNVEAAVAITGHRWPGGRIPFVIAAGMPNQQRVTDAIAHWQANTKITFVQRAAEPDYVEFFEGSGCWSGVGRQGGKQQISLGSGCGTGNAIHEIGHTVGLWHEQSREDRDTFVTIQWANIVSGMEHNFNQHIADGDDIGAYDYCSIMHYPPDAFSKNGQPTIVAKQPTSCTLGQRDGLSPGDIAAIKVMYPELYPVTPVKKLLDDGGGVKKFRDDSGGVKKLLDDSGGVKKFRDDSGGGIKKVRDDVIPVKKIRDDVVVKPVGDLQPGPGPLVNPAVTAALGGTLPFALQLGHQDPMAAALTDDTATQALWAVTAYDEQIEYLTETMVSAATQLGQLREARRSIADGLGGLGA